MDEGKIQTLKAELAHVRREAVAASIAGDHERAECLTSKAVGMKGTIETAEKALSRSRDHGAVGELEGVERVLQVLNPLPKC